MGQHTHYLILPTQLKLISKITLHFAKNLCSCKIQIALSNKTSDSTTVKIPKPICRQSERNASFKSSNKNYANFYYIKNYLYKTYFKYFLKHLNTFNITFIFFYL